MRNTAAIMQRELLSLFCSPVAYIVLMGFLIATGVIAWVTSAFEPGAPATLRTVFTGTMFVLVIFVPAISMRTISEEYRSGTFESLMTAPVSDFQLVLGKYLATMVFYLIMIAGTLVYPIMMMIFGSPSLGVAFSGYLGLIAVGSAFMAVGIFASSLTRNQIVAWILGTIPLVLLVLFGQFFVQFFEGRLRSFFQSLNIVRRFDQFNRGLISSEDVVFFLGVTVLFLFLAVKVVESRRWR
ncbi:MAG: ABC transporter permease subunit [Planctomycetes bacterium]|nr:ABC transporter permease subunit [Planctomycetota bacterium]